MKILILDTNRRDSTSLYHLYTKLGHEVFCIKPYSTELIDWSTSTIWPCLLAWSKEDPNQTNFEYHGFNKLNEMKYGEDNFLLIEKFVEPISDKHVQVKLVEIEKENNFFDAVHILPHFHEKWFDNVRFILENFCKNAKIINSTFDPGNFKERIEMFENPCEFLPAIYDGVSKHLGIENSAGFIRHPVEIEVLGINKEDHKNDWVNHRNFVSFMHNFKSRQGENRERYFKDMSLWLKDNLNTKLENFGGNIRGQGADLRYSGEKGITGNYTTLSPRGASLEYFKSRGIVHLKDDDWAGGCEIGARAAGCPMIVFSSYFNYTKMQRTWGKIYTECLFSADDPQKTIGSINYLLDDENCRKTRDLIFSNNEDIFNEEYWIGWSNFLNNLR